MLFLVWILLVVGPVGGYVCAKLAGHKYIAHGVALAVLSVAIYLKEVLTSPPGTEPLYFVVSTFIVDPIGILFGAYVYSRRVSRGKIALPAQAAS